MSQAEFVDELLVGPRFLQRVEVFPVEVLHQSLLEARDIARIRLHQDGDGLKTSPAGGAPAALSGNQFVALALTFDLAHQDRLEKSHFPDGSSQ